MYKGINDDELIYMISENEDYYEVLLKKYEPMLIKICKKYVFLGENIGFEFLDLMQVARISLIEAIKHYNNQKSVLFYTYISRCIENGIKTEIRNHQTNKKKILNESISYDIKVRNGESLIDLIADNNILSPDDYLQERELEANYIKFINSLPFEVAIAFEMKNNGFTRKEIASLLEVTDNEITKFVSFARRKIKKQLCLN